MAGKYIAVVYRRKKCPKCDADAKEGYEPGFWDRHDCGCVYTVEIGRYDCLSTARLVAARQAMQPGTRHGGRNTGHWNVETEVDGVVASN